MAITYRKGDATNPVLGDKPALLIHICNNANGFGKGFAYAVKQRWPQVKEAYHQWHHLGHNDKGERFELGNIQSVQVEPNLQIINMLAQAGYGTNNASRHQGKKPNSTPPIRYEALEQCLVKVALLARKLNAQVVGPRFGSGLAGGDWGRIETIINRCLADIDVTIYDYSEALTS